MINHGHCHGNKEFHIAPMIDVSTVEFRYFIRLLTKRAVIWNEMVVAETLVHRNRIHKQQCRKENSSCELSSSSDIDDGSDEDIKLTHDLMKHCGWYDACVVDDVSPNPTIFQIGTNNPDEGAFATRLAQKCGYDSIDLNCGCPSDRVVGKCFGAQLMKDQDTADTIVRSLVDTAQSLDNPSFQVSVKTRIGVDENTGLDFIVGFVQRLMDAGCNNFVVHARSLHSEGLSPAQNRTIPPLDYPCVYRLMEYFPQCSFIINGGIMSLEHAKKVAFGCASQENDCECGIEDSYAPNTEHSVPCHLCNLPNGSCLSPPQISPPNLRGVMVGRLARDRPADLADVDRYFYGEPSNPCCNRRELMNRYISFLEREYPRRCCDDDETLTLDMLMYLPLHITFGTNCCSVCEEFRGQNEFKCSSKTETSLLSDAVQAKRTQSSKRSRRHAKYKGAKIVTRIMDRALQPTWGILAGLPGRGVFRRVSHELSRDATARNCGPGYILWKAMQSIPADVWDKPFELSDEQTTTYYPTN
jgi:tRNA-dihydrouridine synthase A